MLFQRHDGLFFSLRHFVCPIDVLFNLGMRFTPQNTKITTTLQLTPLNSVFSTVRAERSRQKHPILCAHCRKDSLDETASLKFVRGAMGFAFGEEVDGCHFGDLGLGFWLRFYLNSISVPWHIDDF